MAGKGVRSVFATGFRFIDGGKVTAVLDTDGKLSLMEEGGMEVFQTWQDYVTTVMGDKPVKGGQEALDQLGMILGVAEPIEVVVKDDNSTRKPKAEVPDNNGTEKGETKMATKKAATKKAAAPKRVKVEKEESPCHCGCDTPTTGKKGFAPGHDARMHGWAKKIGDGRMTFAEINKTLTKSPDLALAWLKTHGVKQGKAAK